MRWPVLLTIVGVLVTPVLADAQSAPQRVEVSAGVRWLAPMHLGRVDANETRADGGDYRLFTTDNDLGAALGGEVRFAMRVKTRWHAEVAASYLPATVTSRIALDVEGSDAIAVEHVRQFAVEGGVAVDLAPRRIVGRSVPFVAAGGGLFRRLHERETLAEDGRSLYVGGGLKYPFPRGGAAWRRAGLRLDARATVISAGLSFDETPRLAALVAASLFVRF